MKNLEQKLKELLAKYEKGLSNLKMGLDNAKANNNEIMSSAYQSGIGITKGVISDLTQILNP